MNTSYIGVGTNLRNRRQNIEDAVKFIAEISQEIIISYIFETPALINDIAENKPYLNTVVKIKTKLSAFELLHELQKIEKKMGQNVDKNFKSRIIDLDILFFNDETIDSTNLKIPHPQAFKRSFVLDPLLHISSGEIFKKSLQASRKQKTKQPLIMAIVNVNDNSFSNDGIVEENAFREKIKDLNKNLMHIIDIGAQSTRPDAVLLDDETEYQVLKKFITIAQDELRKSGFKHTLPKISVDCFQKEVIDRLKKDFDFIINDVSGKIRDDKDIISMHSLSVPADKSVYFKNIQDLETDIKTFLKKTPNKENYIIDIGLGFGKTPQQDLYLIQNMRKLFFKKNLKILIGHSRKSFMSIFSDKTARDREVETIGLSLSMLQNCEIIRVHDAISHKRAILSYLHGINQMI